MTSVSYFYNYGGLLTIFSKRDRDGNYDQSRNPVELNKVVEQINTYKNKAMIVLIPVTLIIGFYFFYKMYKIENPDMDMIFDRVKNGGLVILFISFLMQIWTLNPTHKTYEYQTKMKNYDILLAEYKINTQSSSNYLSSHAVAPTEPIKPNEYDHSAFHPTIREYFSGNILIFVLLFLIFGGLFAGTQMWLRNNTGSGTGTSSGSGSANDEPKSYYYLAGLVSFFILFITSTAIGLHQFYFTPNRPQTDTGNGLCPDNKTYKVDKNGSNCDKDAKEKRLNQAYAGTAITLITVISIIWSVFIVNELKNLNIISNVDSSGINIVLQVFRIIFGLLFSSLLIYISVTTINGVTKPLGGLHLVVNLIMVICVFIIMYKMLKIETNPKVHNTYQLLLDIFFYIPCLFITLYDNLPNASGLGTGLASGLASTLTGAPSELAKGVTSQFAYIKILVGIILLYLGYFYYLKYSASFTNQNGHVILTTPISLNKHTRISNGDYITLNKKTKQSQKDGTTTNESSLNKYNYNYAISFWIYLDATNLTVDKYITILDYGGKPTVLYNPVTKTIQITMLSTSTSTTIDAAIIEAEKNSKNKLIYESKDIPLQKWNNIIINYLDGGTLDIFINGELVQSGQNVTPFMEYDALKVGQKNGLNGGICNIIYFTEALTSRQIFYLYTILKDSDPPLEQNTEQLMYNISNHK